ncbi:polyprenyl synthetase family protein [Streptomyces ovatisporus]|uniref:Polyprenyl synthetase family protein n=1 Tax=Streptomyces ovatisporus TaxID=1128682 RepID=A0ABV9A5L9_9ACTN
MTPLDSPTAQARTAGDDLVRRLPDARPSLALLHREMERRWPAGLPDVDRISRYALLPAGKLLRPLLVTESAAAVGGDPEQAVSAALGVEYLHVGSLVHDDVIDGDATRRGRPSVAAHFGTADAIVTGDALIFDAVQAAAGCTRDRLPAETLLSVVRTLAGAGIELCRGQTLEAELCGDTECGMERYLRMIALKTGALFRAACRIGALLGGATARQADALEQFAAHCGLAFQMSDDLLPHTGDGTASGKPPLSDAANGRPTFPVLLAHELAGPAERRRLAAALASGTPAAEAQRTVREVLETTGALRAARERVQSEAASAENSLSVLAPSRSRNVLAGVARMSVDRDR